MATWPAENGSWYYDELISELLCTILNPPDGTPNTKTKGSAFSFCVAKESSIISTDCN